MTKEAVPLTYSGLGRSKSHYLDRGLEDFDLLSADDP